MQRPNVIKGIPFLLVRALPTIYYYGRYAGVAVPEDVKLRFCAGVDYLHQAVVKIAKQLSDPEMFIVGENIMALQSMPHEKISQALYQLTFRLSDICMRNKQRVKEIYDGETGLNREIAALYDGKISKLFILVIDNDNAAAWCERLAATLVSTCRYKVDLANPAKSSFSGQIIASEFLVFSSATPQTIHDDVNYLSIYQKPGLILAPMKKDSKLDQNTIRNGAWLKKRGFNVLYKNFSPIRLFTTIDKIAIKYLLQKEKSLVT
jgi:hypothetical protein